MKCYRKLSKLPKVEARAPGRASTGNSRPAAKYDGPCAIVQALPLPRSFVVLFPPLRRVGAREHRVRPTPRLLSQVSGLFSSELLARFASW